MAFGMEMGGKPGKLILSVFRLLQFLVSAGFLHRLYVKTLISD